MPSKLDYWKTKQIRKCRDQGWYEMPGAGLVFWTRYINKLVERPEKLAFRWAVQPSDRALLPSLKDVRFVTMFEKGGRVVFTSSN